MITVLNVLVLIGSPRGGKNGDVLVDKIIEGMDTGSTNIEKLYTKDLSIGPCIACDGCTRQLGCVIKDGMNDMYEKFNKADIVIMGSPLYFNSINAQLKSVIDRCQAIWSSKYVLNNSLINRDKKRLGFFVCTAGVSLEDDPELFKATTPILDLFFKSINCEYAGNLFADNVDNHPTWENHSLLEKAHSIGQDLINQF